MSGNPTNDGYFLDTCIYINYGVIDDIFHSESVAFFCKNCSKHTSESVLVEIQNFKNFMGKFGRDLNFVLNREKKSRVLKDPLLFFPDYNDNQMTFIEGFLKVVSCRPVPQILDEYRSLKGLVVDRIDDALDKTSKPFIKQSNDTVFLQKITYVTDQDDRQIISDAALWASQFRFRRFCTSDRVHILHNKTPLELEITNHYGRNCLIFIHVKNA